MPSKIRLALCRMYPRATKFQNIVCYCLSRSDLINRSMMLLFIHQAGNSIPVPILFQNIVCYYLSWQTRCNAQVYQISKHRMLLFIELLDLKKEDVNLFQNIVCYCLSSLSVFACLTTWLISKHHMLLFIGSERYWQAKQSNFKTSYVTVYLPLFQILYCYSYHFKTSYVTVYQPEP